MTPPLVVATELTRSFARPGAADLVALDGVSLTIPRGAFVGMRGPSGSGKSTLLALLGALDRPTAGTVAFDGRDLTGTSDGVLADVRRRIGFVFQHAPMIRGLSVADNVTYALVPCGVSPGERRDLAHRALERVALAERADERPERLSGGERQRVGLARALVDDPVLLVADEPTSQLDPASAVIVIGLLRSFHEAGGTVLAASHDEAVLRGAESLHDLDSGRLVASTPAP